MILRIVLWTLPVLFISFDLTFSDLFVLFPLFFFLESAVDFSFEKALRYVVFLSLYSFVVFKEFGIISILIIFFILFLESFRDNFLKLWVLSLLESVVYFGIRIFVERNIVFIISILIAFGFNFYLLKKKIIEYR
ncbi:MULTISPECIES: hypothetical protein [unclassified Thermosipho (in: thermotogales)]|uniref:hypothetical protein n=1 Tax=unclassified Thermosipho (in: thermotogales) TaxID=2676525 RepID=UPI0009843094|nr:MULTISPECIES: hypothetical protein [unclassified Thermosipho (in: thermotogales)]MBT1247515.1 hypothetical protein [Thermosipho sp. 1244]OOC46241.1 hypothetical protein XO09_07445 [Thermosipho sp. 1223]